MTNSALDRDTLTHGICDIAVRAGAIIMQYYENEITVREKSDKTPVTAADEATEEFILAELAQLTPDIPVIAEELAAAGKLPDVGASFWLVDPLDGTREFINKNGEFTVNIALIEDGVTTAGVVYAPAVKRLFYSAGNGSAYEQSVDPHPGADREPDGPATQISARTAASDGLVVIASRSHRDKKTDEFLETYDVKEIVAAGSSLKFCVVAAGEADLYPRHGPTMEWDTAAGHAVLSGAGGSVKNMDGSPFLYGKPGFKNPYFVARGAD